MTSPASPARRYRLIAAAVAIAVIAIAALWFVSARGAEQPTEADVAMADAGFDARQRVAIEAMVRDYLLKHPEILPEMVDKLREKQTVAAMDGIREELFKPYPGAVLGNPQGSKVLVEFSDYACGYCRQSVKDVDDMIAADSDLKVVVREFPILSEDSVAAARMALAAAHQGKYEAFHRAMYDAGRPTPANIEKAAIAAGLDLAKARTAAASPAIAAEIDANRGFAQQLDFSGTPAWVTKHEALQGAVGRDALEKALAGTPG